MSEHFARDHVPYLDLSEPLATRVRTEAVFFKDDSHTNPVGNQVIAQAVFDKIAGNVATIVERRGLRSQVDGQL